MSAWPIISWITLRSFSFSQKRVQNVCLKLWQEKCGNSCGARFSFFTFFVSSALKSRHICSIARLTQRGVIAVLPSQSHNLTNSVPGPKQQSEYGEPMIIGWRHRNTTNKSRLLCFCQGFSLRFFPVVCPFDLCHNSVSRIQSNNAIPNRC